MIKVRKLFNKNDIWYSIHEWNQIDSTPTAIAALLITLDDIREGEMLEITRIKDESTGIKGNHRITEYTKL